MSSHGLLKACFSVCKKQILRAAFAELVYASLLTGSSLYFSKVIAVAEEKITQTGTTLSSTAFDLIAGGMLLFGVMEVGYIEHQRLATSILTSFSLLDTMPFAKPRVRKQLQEGY